MMENLFKQRQKKIFFSICFTKKKKKRNLRFPFVLKRVHCLTEIGMGCASSTGRVDIDSKKSSTVSPVPSIQFVVTTEPASVNGQRSNESVATACAVTSSSAGAAAGLPVFAAPSGIGQRHDETVATASCQRVRMVINCAPQQQNSGDFQGPPPTTPLSFASTREYIEQDASVEEGEVSKADTDDAADQLLSKAKILSTSQNQDAAKKEVVEHELA